MVDAPHRRRRREAISMMSAAILTFLAVGAFLGPVGGPPRRAPDPVDLVVDDDPGGVGVRRRPQRRLLLPAAALAAILVLGFVPTAAAVVATGAVPRLRRLAAARAAQRAIDAALPDAIELMVLVMQAGMTPHQAVEVLARRAPAPVRPGFAEVRHRVERGAPLADALQALPDILGPGANAPADTLAMAERHGTPIVHTLEQLGLDVRERRRRQAETDARKLPIRMSFPLVVCTLPSFVLVAIVPAVLAAMASLGDAGS
jgi:tight adherence protein C